jgi:hypothetical protein
MNKKTDKNQKRDKNQKWIGVFYFIAVISLLNFLIYQLPYLIVNVDLILIDLLFFYPLIFLALVPLIAIFFYKKTGVFTKVYKVFAVALIVNFLVTLGLRYGFLRSGCLLFSDYIYLISQGIVSLTAIMFCLQHYKVIKENYPAFIWLYLLLILLAVPGLLLLSVVINC